MRRNLMGSMSRVVGLAWGAAALAFAVAPPGQAEGVPESQAWPANVAVIEAKLAPSEFEKPDFQLELPQLRIYDARGRLLYDQTGYDAEHFAGLMRKALTGKLQPRAGGKPLESELQRFQAKDGQPLGPQPAQAVQIVEWWADWCVPCRSQARELSRILGESPETRVALFHVEASRPGFSGKMIKLDDSKLTPEMLRKLKDPKVPAAEKQKIIEAARLPAERAKPQETPPPRR